jgi:pentatricopeptide repeat protein
MRAMGVVADAVSFNVLLSAFERSSQLDEALHLYDTMQAQVFTYITSHFTCIASHFTYMTVSSTKPSTSTTPFRPWDSRVK